MPPRYPKQDGRFLAWARNITRVWTGWRPGGGSTGVPDIGLSEQQAQRAVELFEAAYAAHRHQEAMRSAARAATLAKREAFKAFKDALGADIATINAYARTTGDPGVFVRAALPPRKKAGERRPVDPASPRLRWRTSDGAMVLTWRGATLPGTVYRVERLLTPGDPIDAPYRLVAAVTRRAFVDESIPPGTVQVRYRVRAFKHGFTTPGFVATATLHGEKWKTGAAPVTQRSARSA